MIYSKATSVVLAFLLAPQIAFSQPHGRRHDRRDSNVVYETSVVYVDQYGNTLDPAAYGHPTTPTVSSTPVVTISTIQPTTSASTTPSSGIAASSPDASGSTSKDIVASTGQGGSGIAYNPYYDNGQCKSFDDVSADIKNLKNFGVIRIYDLSCQQVKNVTAIAKTYGIKVYIGIPNGLVSNCDAAIAQIVDEVSGNWASVDTISIGNELVTGGQMTADAVVSLVDSSRTKLRAAGYTGPVVTTEAWITFINPPANNVLCQHSDYVAANCHPFFDSNVKASDSGKFVSDSIGKLQAACSGKDVVITETGWPHQGSVFNQAVPGITEQQDALTSIRNSVTSNRVLYFEAFDATWKVDNGNTYGTEKYWGVQNLAQVS